MILYLLVIITANVGLGYALVVYLNRRARLWAWSAQHVAEVPQAATTTPAANVAPPADTVPAESARPVLEPELSALADARQLKATIDDGLSQITREAEADAASEPAAELASTSA